MSHSLSSYVWDDESPLRVSMTKREADSWVLSGNTEHARKEEVVIFLEQILAPDFRRYSSLDIGPG